MLKRTKDLSITSGRVSRAFLKDLRKRFLESSSSENYHLLKLEEKPIIPQLTTYLLKDSTVWKINVLLPFSTVAGSAHSRNSVPTCWDHLAVHQHQGCRHQFYMNISTQKAFATKSFVLVITSPQKVDVILTSKYHVTSFAWIKTFKRTYDVPSVL